jgi:hypothetical protein
VNNYYANKRVASYVYIPWFTSKIKMLITERDKLKRKAIITKQESDWLIYKKARNQTNTELRKPKQIIILKRLLTKGAIQSRLGKLLIV